MRAQIRDVAHPDTCFTELPKALREVIKTFATDLTALRLEIEHTLKEVASTEEQPIPVVDNTIVDPVEWDEGVDNYKTVSVDVLCKKLGIKPDADGRVQLPHFNKFIDPTGTQNPTDDPDAFSKDCAREGQIPLHVHWHQLVGIHKMVSNAFNGLPVLLMDDVGVGKTLQVLGTIAILAFFRSYYAEHKKFPGEFGTCHI